MYFLEVFLAKGGVVFFLVLFQGSCKAMRVASEIRPLVLIQTSVVIEWVANSSLPSRHHPLCRLRLPSALAFIRDSLRGGWDLFLAVGDAYNYQQSCSGSMRFALSCYCLFASTRVRRVCKKEPRRARVLFFRTSDAHTQMTQDVTWPVCTNK